MCILAQKHTPDNSPGEQAVQCVMDTSAFTYSLRFFIPFEFAKEEASGGC